MLVAYSHTEVKTSERDAGLPYGVKGNGGEGRQSFVSIRENIRRMNDTFSLSLLSM
jgi:hypothetical protein